MKKAQQRTDTKETRNVLDKLQKQLKKRKN